MRQPKSTATGKDDIRRQNLAALLRTVHFDGVTSRAALGERLGLSKTTIAELVSELETAGLLLRVGNEQSGSAGRPSQLVTASQEPLVLVANPEIDGLTLAFVNFAAEIVAGEFFEFDEAYSLETMMAFMQRYLAANQALCGGRLIGVVVAVPGAVDRDTGRLINAPSLQWRDLDVAGEIRSSLKLPAWITNNARAATVSEHCFGAAKTFKNAICLFSGVGGVGGGIIVNGQVLEGSNGIAGEIGKMRLTAESSKKQLTFGELMHREELVAVLGKTRLTDAQLDELLVSSKDPEVNKVIDSQVAVLKSALETLRDLFDPEAVLLGGFLGSLAKSRKGQLSKSLNHESLKVRGEDFLISRAAELKPMVLLGAAEAAWQEILDDPIKNYRKAKK